MIVNTGWERMPKMKLEDEKFYKAKWPSYALKCEGCGLCLNTIYLDKKIGNLKVGGYYCTKCIKDAKEFEVNLAKYALP